MNKQIRRKIEMGDRVIEIGADPEIAPTPAITALFDQVETMVTTMKERGSDQSSGTGIFRAGALECRLQASVIREAMREISEIARVLKPADLPGARELFRMPKNVNFQGLLAAARHFAEDVEPYKALFIARALPATFVEDLEALIAKFETAINRKANGRVTKIAGTFGMEATAKMLLSTVQELRAILRVHLKAKPELLESWKHAARIESDRRSKVELPPDSGSGTGSESGTATSIAV